DPDLIIINTLLPDTKGIEICKLIRNTPYTSKIPIIALSNKENFEEKVRYFEAGSDDFLVKPINPSELSARINAILRRTHKRTRTNRENYNLLSYLAGKYGKRGFRVYSKIIDDLPDIPPEWNGPTPDLYITRNGDRIAFWAETIESLLDENTYDRWISIRENRGVQLSILVRSRKSYKIAKSILKDKNLRVKLSLMKRITSKSGKKRYGIKITRKVKLMIIIFLITIFFGLLAAKPLLDFLSNFWQFKGDYYEPKDIDRRKELLKSEMEKLKKFEEEK
ncbi:MAG: response regulator transcription factor, partial [Fidelibacterota bacterium]